MTIKLNLIQPETVLELTNGFNAEVETELRRQLLVGLQFALQIDNLQIFCRERGSKKKKKVHKVSKIADRLNKTIW